MEYADPELDKVLSCEGDKSNILDEQLDLVEKPEPQSKKKVKFEEGETENPHESADLQNKLLDFNQHKRLSKHPEVKIEVNCAVEPDFMSKMKAEMKLEHPQNVPSTSDNIVTYNASELTKNPHLQKPQHCQSRPPPPPYQSPASAVQPSAIQSMNVAKEIGSNVLSRQKAMLQGKPSLLDDLLEQEKKEQRQQQNVGLIGEEPLLSDQDFEKLKADVLGSHPAQMNIPGSDPQMSQIPQVRRLMNPRAIPPQIIAAQRRFPAPSQQVGTPMPDWQGQQGIPSQFQNPNVKSINMPNPRMPGVMQSPTHAPSMSPMMPHTTLHRAPGHNSPTGLRSPGIYYFVILL